MLRKIIFLSVLFLSVGCAGGETSAMLPKTVTRNYYNDLRSAALNVKPAQLNLSVEHNEPYGVLLEFLVSDTPVTLVSFATGDASLYLGSGNEVIGGITHENVRAASKNFVLEANKYTNQMSATTTFPAPTSGKVRFYVLTPDSVLTVEANEQELVDRASPFSPLFYAGNEVVTQLRSATENK